MSRQNEIKNIQYKTIYFNVVIYIKGQRSLSSVLYTARNYLEAAFVLQRFLVLLNLWFFEYFFLATIACLFARCRLVLALLVLWIMASDFPFDSSESGYRTHAV
jgi:hypothetical protein